MHAKSKKSERDNMKIFVAALNRIDLCVCRIIFDSGIRSHKKPYDAFGVYEGRMFSIEGKNGRAELEEHQRIALIEDNLAGACTLIVRFYLDRIMVSIATAAPITRDGKYGLIEIPYMMLDSDIIKDNESANLAFAEKMDGILKTECPAP